MVQWFKVPDLTSGGPGLKPHPRPCLDRASWFAFTHYAKFDYYYLFLFLNGMPVN